ncbi:MAG TPA: tetratricopeptide repeat protein [Polyangiaceae bacterium]
MRFGPYPVKHSSFPAKSGHSWSRWLDGWVLMFPSVGLALLGACLALPQGTMPDYLPLPRIAAREMDASRRALEQHADAAYRDPLSYDVRAAGEHFRQLGRIAQQGQAISAKERDRFRALLQRARATSGVDAILRLRAVQARLFGAALAEWERTGKEDTDLKELGGDFLKVANALGWCAQKQNDARHRSTPVCLLRLDQDERTALFLSRWVELAGLDADAALRLDPVWPLLALRARLQLPLPRLDERDLRLIERVKQLDPTYPEALGKGLILARLGNTSGAAEAFRMQLQLQPDGPYTLRARNHLQHVLASSIDNGS